MTDIEVQVEVQLASNSPSGRRAFGGLQEDMSCDKESDGPESPQNSIPGDVEESLLLLADVALAPSCGDQPDCSCDCEACCCLEVRQVELSLLTMQLQLQFLMSKADYLQDCLVKGQGNFEREALATAVPTFLYTCQPYFNQVESTARSTMSQDHPLPTGLCSRRMQLLDFSQQLCDRLEQLVLTYASYNLLCLDEKEPNSVSHFLIGQSQLGRVRLSTFLYCRPTPFLAQDDTGLYKRMRWNVDRLRDEQQQQQMDEEQGGESEEREAETVSDTEYYFLCYEDIPSEPTEASGHNRGAYHCSVVRMWSIGQWLQTNPDPDTEDIYDWIMCDMPQACYQRLLVLGSNEPSSCSATDMLQQLLLSQHTTE